MHEPDFKAPNWDESVRRAQDSMRVPVVKRFYKVAEAVPHEGGFAVTLDGRVARTPARAKLVVSAESLAHALAAEWAAQGEVLQPAAMPLTRLAHSALDGVARAMPETIASIAAYAGSDLVFFRAGEPEALAAGQAQAFDPMLVFAERALGARFALAEGITAITQAPQALAAVRAAVEAHAEPLALTALADLTSLSGSVLIALAVSHGEIEAEAAWAAAHVDEDFQNERWGRDAEAMARREARGREFAAAAYVARALRA
jgi:chaperone required for assembly of F1-ATPase